MKIAKSMLLIVTVILVVRFAGAQDVFDAVKKNDLAAAKAILEKDASLVRAKDSSGNTPLHTAAITGSVPMADWLLSRGADINADNLAMMTPLFEAIRNAKDEMALFLIDKGADIGKNGGALVPAALRNRTAVAERLIARGADIDQKKGEYTPLGNAVRMGQFEVTELLVRKGADWNVRDSLGNTILDNAVIYGSDDSSAIDLLLDRFAEVNTDAASLRTTVSAAARRGHPRLFEYYCARGREALFADESNRRAFMRSAILGGSLEIVKKFEARNIPLDFSANAAGLTPLHTLASNPRAIGMIEFLVRNGADLNARTNDGRSAYNIAEAKGNREELAVLLKLGASTEAQKFPVIIGPYLGQPPPAGDELKAFAPGIIAQDHGTIAFSPDGQEVYWPTGTSIMMMKVQDGRWTRPAYASFSGPREIDFSDDVPFVAPDNKRLFFTSRRPLNSEKSQKENIWLVERTADGWSEPQPAGP
jgi:ankyrin repeat protein